MKFLLMCTKQIQMLCSVDCLWGFNMLFLIVLEVKKSHNRAQNGSSICIADYAKLKDYISCISGKKGALYQFQIP